MNSNENETRGGEGQILPCQDNIVLYSYLPCEGPHPDYIGDELFKTPCSAFWRIVSFTATNTRRSTLGSDDCDKLSASGKCIYRCQMMEATCCGYMLRRARFLCINIHRMYLAALLISAPPVYSGKLRSRGTCRHNINTRECK